MAKKRFFRYVSNIARDLCGSNDFAAVICDQTAVLSIDTLGYNFPLLKSRLTPIKEKQVLTICQPQKPSREHTWYHLAHRDLIGLTRKERELKGLLLFMFEQLA